MEWREIWRSDDVSQARAVATAIESMEYAARLRSSNGRRADDETAAAPFVVEVHEASWPDLIEVVDEIAREQDDFDRFIHAWHERAGRRKRAFLMLLVLIVAALAIIGAIDL